MAEHGVVSVTWRDAAREMSAGLHELVDGLPEWAQEHPRLDEALSAYEGHMVTTATRAHVLAMLKGMDNAPPPRFAVKPYASHGGLMIRAYADSDGDYTNEIWMIGIEFGNLFDVGVMVTIPPRLFPVRNFLVRLLRRG